MVKNIALAGFGLEGRASLDYLLQLYPEAKFTIYDQNPDLARQVDNLASNVELVSGANIDFKTIEADLIVRSPGIPPRRFAKNANLTSQTNLFFAACPAKIIGVTGTKGKGTTSSLITAILRAAGKKVHLVGNIGQPALSQLNRIGKDDIVVYEMSSFQLWDACYSPNLAVILMIVPDHLDTHSDMAEYVAAKANIVKHQKLDDVVVHHPDNRLSLSLAALSPANNKISYGDKTGLGVYSEANNFCVQGKVICSLDELQLPGEHNIENACAAITAALQLGVDYQAVAHGLANFKGLPHRLKLLRELNGVKYYDDNYSTQPSATMVALKALSQPKILIAGGHDKGVDFTELAEAIKQDGAVKRVLLIGATAPKIKKALERFDYQAVEILDYVDLVTTLRHAQSFTQSGDAVLMSPACASFGLFKNVNDRGEQYIDAVKQLRSK